MLRWVRERRKGILNVSLHVSERNNIQMKFIVRSSKLFCRASKEVLALKKVLLSITSSCKNTSVGKRSLHWRVKKSLEFRKPYMCMTVKPISW